MNSKEAADTAPDDNKYAAEDVGLGYAGGEENVVRKDELVEGDGLFARLQRFAGKFGVEQRGIERVPADERTDSSMSQVGTLVSERERKRKRKRKREEKEKEKEKEKESTPLPTRAPV